jgi:hypothetical protein
MKDQGTQTVYDKYILGAKIETMVMKNQQVVKNADVMGNETEQNSAVLKLDSVKNDEKKMRFFTGLSFLQFMALFNFLGDGVNNLKYIKSGKKEAEGPEISVENVNGVDKDKPGPGRTTSKTDELFMTLLRLRRGYSFYALSHFCKISETRYRVIFTTWLQLLYCHFNDLRSVMFPPRQHLKRFMPKSFRSFKNLRCVVDCTEFFVQMPRNFSRQGNLYSNYKHHCTFKALIAVGPNGTGVFVSDLYEGAISDKELFERCGIINYLLPEDLVLADRGFTVKEYLMKKGVHLNIPPFLMGRDKLTPQEELLTRRIAKARIHVERYNERVKRFKLISGTIPLNIAPIANQAVFVACCLVKFQDQLVQ